MVARVRSWWQQIKQHPFNVAGIIVGSVLLVALIVIEIRANGTGFAGKTLWDWLQLLAALAIPVLVGFGAVWFTTRQNHDREIAADLQREAALQAYLDKMSELLLEKHLRQSQPGNEVRTVATVRTLTLLTQLDPLRRRSVLRFLQQADLINRGSTIVNLSSASLRFADLHRATLSDTDLSRSSLRNANLSRAALDGADLSEADLRDADLSGADMKGALQLHFVGDSWL